MAQENISAQLNDLLTSRNFDPEMLDYQGKPSTPEEATVFSFDYVSSSGKNYGTMVIVLDNENDLQVFYGDNLGRSMEGNDKSEFFDFIQHLHKFANMRRWTFSPKDITRVKNTMQGLAAIREGLFEGYYGTRKVSYSGEPTEARLVIKHNRVLGETDARFRYVESLFIETADSERFRLPFKNLAGGRAMLEHVRQGGRPYDIRGCHIAEMVSELATLGRFNRASRSRVLEGASAELVTEAQAYYRSLQENLKRLSHSRGYATYFESWHPATVTEQEELVENIKTLFVEQTIDTRIEQALPLLAKIKETSMKEVEIFENWVDQLSEGTWALPDTPEKIQQLQDLLSNELVVGPDATNATELLYDLVGDDQLFDQLQDIAKTDPDADVRDVVQQRLQQLGVDLGNEPGVEFTDQTDAVDDEEVSEGKVDYNFDIEDIKRLEKINDLPTLKAQAFELIKRPSARPMKPEKVEWFKNRLEDLNSPMKVIKLMYDLMLSGEGFGVVGSRDSMRSNTYRQRFGEESTTETYDASMDPEYRRPESDRIDPDDRDQDPVSYGSSPALQRSPEQEREFEKYMRYLNRDQKGVTEGSNDDPINYNAAITGSYHESKQDPLDRLKTLALVKKS